MKKIAVLTAGGDCPGLNAVLRAVVKTAINDYGISVLGIKDGYWGLVENEMQHLSFEKVSGILTLGGTILGTSNKADPFRFPVKKKGKITYEDLSDKAIENCRKRGIEALICIGGDGTLTVANKLIQKGLKIVGVPKTIDNDLSGTDVTFGFDTAVANATEAIDKIHTTAMSHHRVLVIETMGRYAGWIALTSGVAGGGDIILIPEIPYDIKKICERVKERGRRGKRFSIIIVAEGARPKDGDIVVSRIVEGSPEPIRLGGIGQKIGQEIEKRTGIETRVAVLGHLQRGGTPTAFDRILATRYGTHSVHLLKQGKFGHMVALKGQRITSIPISQAIKKLKLVPLNHPLIQAARSVGTSFGD